MSLGEGQAQERVGMRDESDNLINEVAELEAEVSHLLPYFIDRDVGKSPGRPELETTQASLPVVLHEAVMRLRDVTQDLREIRGRL